MQKGNITENKFREWCKKNKFFCKKLLTHNISGNGVYQEADFLVANFDNVYLVECKERNGNLFEFSGLHQEKRLKLVTEKTSKLIPYILINYVDHKILFFSKLNNYLKLKSQSKFKNNKFRKSINIKSIPKNFLYTWKTLKF